MTRFVPRSLFGRLSLMTLAVLIAAQLISFGLHLHERGELLLQASGIRSAQRVADIVRLFETVNPADRRAIAATLSAPPIAVRIDRPAMQPAEGGASQRTGATLSGLMLRRSLGDERPVLVRIGDAVAAPADEPVPGRGPMMSGRMGPGAGPMQGFGPGAHYFSQPGLVITAQVRLADATLVTVETRQPAQTDDWSWRLLWSGLILLGAAILVTTVAVIWATRPLATLAAAAEELGRNVNRPPLDETGPSEVVRAARAFNTMQSRLVETMRSRTALLAAMSHDIKTPITRLRLRSEMLDDGKLRERYEQDLSELESMVQSTLDFLRGIDTGETARALDVMAMVESLQADLQETGARVTVEGATDRPFVGQRQALRRCLGNLLDNAIQYGGEAHIVVADSETRLAIHVRDTGPGIPPDQIEKVFEPFYRIEGSRNRETGGTGLGLAIARQLARAHGGDVTLANLAGGGLEAKLVLPRARTGAS